MAAVAEKIQATLAELESERQRKVPAKVPLQEEADLVRAALKVVDPVLLAVNRVVNKVDNQLLFEQDYSICSSWRSNL